MEGNKTDIVDAVLTGAGILALLAAAFDIFPPQDNLLVFAGIACFIIAAILRKASKGGCCK